MKLINFAEQYLTYHDPIKGEWVVGVKLQHYEKNFLKSLSAFNYTANIASRQMHMSTLMATYIAHAMIFDKKKIGVMGNNLDQSKEMISKIRLIIKNYILKNPLKVNIFDENKRVITLNNGGAVKAFINNGIAGCSQNVDILFIDHAAFIYNLREIIVAMTPTLAVGGSLHMVSTPNGINEFHKLYSNGLTGRNKYLAGRYQYSLNSKYTPEWVEDMKRSISNDDRWRQEMELEFFSADRAKNKMVQFRLTTELFDKIEMRAYEKKLSVSKYLRNLIDNDLQNKD